MTNGKDPVLAEQAENRKILDAVLAKYGWRLGAVKAKGCGIFLDYELIHATGDVLHHSVRLTDILLWNATGLNDLAPLPMLTLQLVEHAKQRNAERDTRNKT